MHTTSHPRRRSRGKDARTSQPSPLKSIRLRVDVFGAGGAELKRLAAEKGFAVEEDGDEVSLVIMSKTPEDALARLAVIRGILASIP